MRTRPRNPHYRLALTFTIALTLLASLVGGAALVNAIISSPPVHHVCVDQHGNLRLLSEGATAECKKNEHAIELPTNERVLAVESSISSIGSALGDLEQNAAAIPTLQAQLLAMDDALTVLAGSIPPDQSSAIAALEADLLAMNNALATLAGSIPPDPGPAIAALQADLLAMNTEHAAMTASIAALLARIEALEQGVPPIPNASPTPTPIGNLETAILGILGPTGSVMPLTATGLEPAIASLRGAQAPASTFTWNGLPFDVPPVTTGTVPIVTFNGSGEFASTPDATYWTPSDGSSDHAFSVGAWVRIDGTSSLRTILGKYGIGSGEWLFRIGADNKLRFVASDNSKGFDVSRTTNTPLSAGTWLHIVAVYDADNPDWTGATAMDYITFYVNGAAISSSAWNNPGYEAVEDLYAPITLGSYFSGNFFKGDMAGGQLGPFITHAALDVGQINDLYQIGQTVLGP